jgi:hypothetical protein
MMKRLECQIQENRQKADAYDADLRRFEIQWAAFDQEVHSAINQDYFSKTSDYRAFTSLAYRHYIYERACISSAPLSVISDLSILYSQWCHSSLLGTQSKKLINQIARSEGSTLGEIAVATRITAAVARSALKRLEDLSVVERRSDKDQGFHVLDPLLRFHLQHGAGSRESIQEHVGNEFWIAAEKTRAECVEFLRGLPPKPVVHEFQYSLLFEE